MFRQKRSVKGSIAALIVLAAALLVAVFAFINQQRIIDHITVRQYRADESIQALVERSRMSDQGRFYFYASWPSLKDAAAFNQLCSKDKEESAAILGCYDGRLIYIYNVTDPKLDGIREVTAAHEMLHAAWDRLSGSDKDRLGLLLQAEYDKRIHDQSFAERMAFYDRTEPGQRQNELHSILGTEFGDIADELEVHYRSYFTDRQAVVTLYKNYASVFTRLQEQSAALSAELTSLGQKIEASSAQYNTDVAQLGRDIATFNERAQAGEFSSPAEFQQARRVLVVRAEQLDGARRAINGDIARYETLREQLLAIASESQALSQSLNSSLAPAPQL